MTIDPAEIERYRLPEADNARIFEEQIVPDQLEGREPQATPTVVFIIGAPGAGKSRVTELVAQVLNQHGGFVDVDSDLYKPYHPAYDALMAQDDTLMAAYTRADGRAWMGQAEAYVRTHGLHAIIQETSQNAAAVEDKMLAYRASGARVEALFMGVPQAMSNQGIVARYFEQLADRGQGRLTVQTNADESYRGILDLADRVDQRALADLVSIYRRGESEPRYSNSLDTTGSWQAAPELREHLEAERARLWTAAESEGFVTTQLRLREASRPLGAEWPARLARIEQEAAPLLAPAEAQRLAPPPDHTVRPEVWAAYSDAQLAALQDHSQHAAAESRERVHELQEQHSALRTAFEEQDGGPVVAQLRAQGAAAETIERARNAAAQDIAYAEQTVVETRAAGQAAAGRAQEVGSELQRRAALSPQQRQAEELARQALAAQRPMPPPVAPRSPRAQQQPPGRGQSL
ncbi:zeta toxin family protein [Streptomyces violascens]|uniref:zeta toxin family protein n=1 Tax=Streptomyces violascens TaxID=67381 RepID=UPI0036B6535F